jgi:hypothetical protein
VNHWSLQGWMGPNYSISTACATSNFCILSAANHIIRGEAVSYMCVVILNDSLFTLFHQRIWLELVGEELCNGCGMYCQNNLNCIQVDLNCKEKSIYFVKVMMIGVVSFSRAFRMWCCLVVLMQQLFQLVSLSCIHMWGQDQVSGVM